MCEIDSDQFITFDEFGLSGDRHLTEVKNAPEERFPGSPLDHFLFWEEKKAEGESYKEYDFE